jgi:hypothetical protein
MAFLVRICLCLGPVSRLDLNDLTRQDAQG